jgi:hypothetical protein
VAWICTNIYLAMVIDLPPWTIQAIDKIRRGFTCMEGAKGGNCSIA